MLLEIHPLVITLLDIHSGSRNQYIKPGTSYLGTTPASRQQYVGNLVSSQGGFFPTTLATSVYVGYQGSIPTLYSVKNMKSAVPRLRKDDTNSYLVFARKFCTNLISNNLDHMTDGMYMKAMLPNSQDQVYIVPRDHPWVLAVHNNDRVMALYSMAIQYSAASIVLEEAKTDEYW